MSTSLDFTPFVRSNYGPRVVDLTGRNFDRLEVLGVAGYRENKKLVWVCLCNCAARTVVAVRSTHLTARAIRSCGCLFVEGATARAAAGTGVVKTTHGKSTSPIYAVYKSMVARCTRQTDTNYARYGGRGIAVCERWSGENGFENFYADMGDPPFKGASIDRKDNDGPYSLENCRWRTRTQQARNKRNSLYVTYNDEQVLLIELAERYGVSYKEVHRRVFTRKWSIEKALTHPIRQFKKD